MWMKTRKRAAAATGGASCCGMSEKRGATMTDAGRGRELKVDLSAADGR